jgi:hypothetical protein
LSQLVEVAAVNSATITFDTPITIRSMWPTQAQ